MDQFNSLFDIFDIDNHSWKYPDRSYEPKDDLTVPFDPTDDNHWDQHWDEHWNHDTDSTDDLDLVGDDDLRQLIEDAPPGSDVHLCTRAMLTKPSNVHGCRFCKSCGMLWPQEHTPLW